MSTGASLIINNNPKLTALQFSSLQKIGVNAATNSALLVIDANNNNQAITSPGCKALKDACRNTPQCNGNPNHNNIDNKGPDLKTCN